MLIDIQLFNYYIYLFYIGSHIGSTHILKKKKIYIYLLPAPHFMIIDILFNILMFILFLFTVIIIVFTI